MRNFVLGCLLFSSPFAYGKVSLHDVQNALSATRASWTAADTEVVDLMDIYENVNPFGYDPNLKDGDIPYDDSDVIIQLVPPKSLDWRNMGGKNWMSPIKNQAHCGCVAFAHIGMLEARLNIAAHDSQYNPKLSEQYLFSKIGECETGATPFNALYQSQNGIPDEACMPYTSGRMGNDIDTAKACGTVGSRLFKFKNYGNILSTQVKQHLMVGPLMTTMVVYEDFLYYKEGVYKHVTGENVGGHAVVLVGYNDEEGYWIVRNSWGSNWGEGGYFRIKYDDDSGVGNSVYKMDVVLPNHVVKTEKPEHMEAITGSVNIVIRLLNGLTQWFDPHYRYQYELTCANVPSYISSTMTIKSTEFPDGVCELATKLNSALSKRDSAMPWYTLLTIVNDPKLDITLVPKFDTNRPVTGRAEFSVVSTGNAPLHHAIVSIVGGDFVEAVKPIMLEDPSPESVFGWRSTNTSNGMYKAYVTGYVGAYQVVSKEINFVVAN